MLDLSTADNIASIGTAVVAVIAYVQYRREKGRVRRAIEQYLQEEAAMAGDMGRRSITHIVVALGIPADKVLEAAFESSHIERHARTNDSGLAGDILLGYSRKRIH